MADDELRRLERHLESLLKEYGVLKVEQIRHEERIAEGKDDRAEIRSELAKLEVELLAAMGRQEQRMREHVERVGRECHGFWNEYRADRDAALKRQDAAKVSNRTVVVAMIAGSATVLAAIIGAAAVLLTGG